MDVLRRTAGEEGFTLCGVTPAVASTGFPDLVRWIESGFAGEMSYFADRKEAYRDPSAVLPGARSIDCIGLSIRSVRTGNDSNR